MKILLANDDGYQAQGINELYIKLEKEHNVLMVAPSQERSSCGHGITLNDPIRMHEVEEKIYACSGTPADCVLVSVGKFEKPDLLISGINHGANLGQDRFYSGTIAAAREGAFREIPSIAISLYLYNANTKNHFEVGSKFVKELINYQIHDIIPSKTLLNINIPNTDWENINGCELCLTGHQIYSDEVIERKDNRGNSYFWIGGKYEGHEDKEGTDASTVAQKKISVDLQYFYPEHKPQVKEARKKIEKILDEINNKHFNS